MICLLSPSLLTVYQLFVIGSTPFPKTARNTNERSTAKLTRPRAKMISVEPVVMGSSTISSSSSVGS
ncbi:hypothetical protein J437_LFUL017146 [Ladona fulva]|uniref:Uncharacterized protein n=1 Tax=Ladona fulva TaxID=123851 RepID=A0A8K0P8G7_LADFU|nr:hypothetical protein J437_LFUL017146 [Ladona fulva]